MAAMARRPERRTNFRGVGNSSTVYGQSFLCASLTVEGVEAVAAALTRAELLAYDSAVPAALAPLFPRLAALAEGGRNVSAVPTVLALQSAGGARFTLYSKKSAWRRELWADLVGPALAPGSEMIVETWRRAPALASSCNASRGNILNVNKLAYNASGGVIIKSYTQDHSKYAITAVPPWVCGWRVRRAAAAVPSTSITRQRSGRPSTQLSRAQICATRRRCAL